MKLYRIKRVSDSKFYRGKSKFTTHGTYFRLQQIMANIHWVSSQCDELEIISYDIIEGISINFDENIDSEEMHKMLVRDINIDDILGN